MINRNIFNWSIFSKKANIILELGPGELLSLLLVVVVLYYLILRDVVSNLRFETYSTVWRDLWQSSLWVRIVQTNWRHIYDETEVIGETLWSERFCYLCTEHMCVCIKILHDYPRAFYFNACLPSFCIFFPTQPRRFLLELIVNLVKILCQICVIQIIKSYIMDLEAVLLKSNSLQSRGWR